MTLAVYFLTILNLIQYAHCNSKDLVKERSVIISFNTSYVFSSMDCEGFVKTRVPMSFVAVYEGAVAEMICPSSTEVSWAYAKSLANQTFTTVVQKDRIVIQNRRLFIYRTSVEEAGVYRCQSTDNFSGLIILEVVDDAYTLVTDLPTPNAPKSLDQELTVYNVWSQWSECSVCGKAGRQRRFGMCFVKLNTSQFSVFPEGIPCRSRHLSDEIRNSPSVLTKKNVIAIATCKIQCKEEIFEVRSSTGAILETANNTAGVYSLQQRLPPQPPTPARNILFVERGQRVLVICPGTTLRDIPVTWKVGHLPVDPEILRESSEGRVSVDARDHILITYVVYIDYNLYSCWEGDNLAGTVKLEVWAGEQKWNHHTVLVVMATMGPLLLHFVVRMLFT